MADDVVWLTCHGEVATVQSFSEVLQGSVLRDNVVLAPEVATWHL